METKGQNNNYVFKSESRQNFQEEKEEKIKKNLSFTKKRPIYRSPRYLSKQKNPKPQANTSTNKVNINYKRQIPIPTIKPLENSGKTIKSIQNTSSYSTINTSSQNKNYLSNSNLNVKNNQKGNMVNTKPFLTSSSSYTRSNQVSQNTRINSPNALQIKIPLQQTLNGNNKRKNPITKTGNNSFNNNMNSNSRNSYSKKESNISQVNNKRKMENKENLDENIKKIISHYTYGINSLGNKEQITYKDYGRKDYSFNKIEDVAFKTQKSPNYNIVVVNQTKTLGKNKY